MKDAGKQAPKACFLTTLIVLTDVACANALLPEGACSLYALARDRSLHFYSVLSKMEEKHQLPVVAIVLCSVVHMAFNSINFGTVTGFNSIIAIITEGFYLS
jgi:choline transport protein